jgi:hypothetical protein
MSPSKKKDVALVCYAMVSSTFAMMHNPRFRGPNFNWDEFADMMKERCEKEIFIYVYPCTDEMKSYAKQCGSEIAARLVSYIKE